MQKASETLNSMHANNQSMYYFEAKATPRKRICYYGTFFATSEENARDYIRRAWFNGDACCIITLIKLNDEQTLKIIHGEPTTTVVQGNPKFA